jgi:uncharacterized protein (DUF1501 family)
VDVVTVATVGTPTSATLPPLIVADRGSKEFIPRSNRGDDRFNPLPLIERLNGATNLHSSIFGETWSSALQRAISDSVLLGDAINGLEEDDLKQDWDNASYSNKNALATKLETMIKLMITHDSRGTDRDVFFVDLPGWDHHVDMKVRLADNFQKLNQALTLFVAELKAQGLWEQVTLVTASDFGRTLTPNSGEGSDHGYGGHYFMLGGSVKGRRIHGTYPSDITAKSDLNLGRGRILPTTSWDSYWNGVLEWMGVDDSPDELGLDYCLPNRHQTGTKLYSKEDLFV